MPRHGCGESIGDADVRGKGIKACAVHEHRLRRLSMGKNVSMSKRADDRNDKNSTGITAGCDIAEDTAKQSEAQAGAQDAEQADPCTDQTAAQAIERQRQTARSTVLRRGRIEVGKIMRRRSRDSCLPVQASVIRFRKGAAR